MTDMDLSTAKQLSSNTNRPKDNPLARLKHLTLDNRFCQRKNPVREGQVLQMAWKTPTLLRLDGSDAEARQWDRRAIEYWAVQGYKYGLLIDLENTFTYLWRDMVVTQALVVGVMPGKRVPEKVWRRLNPPGKLVQQLGLAMQ